MKNLYLSLLLIMLSAPSSASDVISKLFLAPPQSSVNILSFYDSDKVKNQLNFTAVIRDQTIGTVKSPLEFTIKLNNDDSYLQIIFEQPSKNQLTMRMIGIDVDDHGTPMTAVQNKKTKKISLLNPPTRKKSKGLPNKAFNLASTSYMKVAITGLQNRAIKIDIKIGEQIEMYLVDVNFGINRVDIAHLSGELNLFNFTYE